MNIIKRVKKIDISVNRAQQQSLNVKIYTDRYPKNV